ncbi:MAG TPA: nitrilase-related carbon-nitrogen hydrolase [Candidatus Dormibacteraeota bacterium]|jgi:predicted amidohydrolase|nr:nitrilase-related carbon-nitrogen hydrolase [Candidatus Dormibacteraeota bacterium]
MSATIPGTGTEPTPATVPHAAAAEMGADGGVIAVLAQIAPRLGDVPRNLERHLSVAAEAREGGAHLVVFPELSLTGYFLKDLVPDVALRQDAPELADLARASDGVDLVVGAVLETEDARFHNAALYFSGGRLVHVHRKVYLPTYGLFDEQRYFAQGDRFRVVAAPLPAARQPRPWHAGLLICEDMWHLSAPMLLARQGIDVLLCPSSSPGRGVAHGAALGTAMSYDAMTRTYAQLTTSYVLYCNRVGYEDGVNFWGGSRIVDPEGRVLVEGGDREELLWHRIDLGAIRRARLAYPLVRDERHDLVDAEIDRLRHRRLTEQ